MRTGLHRPDEPRALQADSKSTHAACRTPTIPAPPAVQVEAQAPKTQCIRDTEPAAIRVLAVRAVDAAVRAGDLRAISVVVLAILIVLMTNIEI